MVVYIHLAPGIARAIGELGNVEIGVGAHISHVDGALEGGQGRRLIAGVRRHLLPGTPGATAIFAGVPVEEAIVRAGGGVVTHHSGIQHAIELRKRWGAWGEAAFIGCPRWCERADVYRAALLLQSPAAAVIRELNAGVEPGGAVGIAEVGNGIDPNLGVLAGAAAHIGKQQVAIHTHGHRRQRTAQTTVAAGEGCGCPAQVGLGKVNTAVAVDLDAIHRSAIGSHNIQAVQTDRAIAIGIGERQTCIGGGEHRCRSDRGPTAGGREGGAQLQARSATSSGINPNGALVIHSQYGSGPQPGEGRRIGGGNRGGDAILQNLQLKRRVPGLVSLRIVQKTSLHRIAISRCTDSGQQKI